MRRQDPLGMVGDLGMVGHAAWLRRTLTGLSDGARLNAPKKMEVAFMPAAHEVEPESESDLSQHNTPRVERSQKTYKTYADMSDAHSANTAADTGVPSPSHLSALVTRLADENLQRAVVVSAEAKANSDDGEEANQQTRAARKSLDTISECINAPLQEGQELLNVLPPRRSSTASAAIRSLCCVEESDEDEDELLDMLREQQEAQMREVLLRENIWRREEEQRREDEEDQKNLEEMEMHILRIEQMEMQRLRAALVKENHASAAAPSERRARPTTAPANQRASTYLPSVARDSSDERDSSPEAAAAAQKAQRKGMRRVLTAARHPVRTLLGGKGNMVNPLLKGQGDMEEGG